MKKDKILKRKRFLQFTKVTMVLLVFLILITSSTISENVTQQKIIEVKNIEDNKLDKIISDGLAPRNKYYPIKPTIQKSDLSKELNNDCSTMYGYNVEPDPEKTIFFDTCDPGTLNYINTTQSENFISGGTCIPSNIWLGCEYGTGAIWEIQFDTGEMHLIGGGGESLNSLAYNPIDNRIYASGDDNCLYEIDPDNGEQELIGPFDNGVDCMIGMAFDHDGVLYGWDLGNDKLWTIDTETCEATEIGPLGIDLNYAQDGDFLRETDILYLTAYTTTGQLYACDKTTGQCELIGNFEDGAQITASVFDQCIWCCEHDIGLKRIDYPRTGRAEPDMKMQITAKNLGNNTETFNTKLEVMKNVTGPIIMQENFDGDFPPNGWTTDYWTQSYTNESGGIIPEARVYNIDQYNGGQKYDNYIQSGYINCTGYNRIRLRFRWAADYNYPQYCSVYVKIRNNSSSSWKYVTPWDDPVGENQDGELWETEWIGFDGPIGEGLQIRWEYVGYYYYYNYLWLDNISIEACADCLEYSENIENIVLEPGKYKKIDFPNWTPNDWQNESFENKWIKYLVNANIDLDSDTNPRNDEKKKWIDLYFGFFNDVGCNNISSPITGPAKTFPVTSHVKNFGQFNQSNFKTYVEIAELDLDNKFEILIEDFSESTFPPNGWTKTHNNWMYSSSSYAGGSTGEARFYFSPYSNDTFRLISPSIDVSEYEAIEIDFNQYIDHYTSPYSLKLESSVDAENWDTIWKIYPTEDLGPITINIPFIKIFSENIYFSWVFEGNSYNIDNWYIDNIIISGYSTYEPEYEDTQIIDFIKPGEEIEINFSEWTPEFLYEEESGQKNYIIKSWTNLEIPEDQNSDNDLFKKEIILKFWHDVGIDEITSPVGVYNFLGGDEVIWDNGEPDGRNKLPGSMFMGFSNILIDDIEIDGNYAIQGGKVHFIWDSGYTSNTETIRMYFFEETGDCDPSLDEYPEEGFFVEANRFDEYTTGQYYFSRPEVVVDFTLDEEVILNPGNWFVGIQPDGVSEDIAYILTAPDNQCMCFADLPFWGYPRWSNSKNLWGTSYDLAFEVHAGTTWYSLYCIKLGTHDIDVIVENYGTFPKENLTCYAEIWETDNKVYDEQIDNIDLTIPLGGQKELNFPDFTFNKEGQYELYLELPAYPDNVEINNEKKLRIGVDNTEPVSDYPPILDPPNPDGCNGWYISDVTVTLNASDPWSNGVSSGVKEIRYTVNGGEELVIPGKTGSFVLTEDGNDILIEYWAVDWVGNVESPKNSFTIDIDQTVPEISLTYDVVGGNKWQGWKFQFTATATDKLSGMDRVEFYLNNELQYTIEGEGPEYKWQIRYNPLPNAIFRATAFDKAGLFNSDEINDPTRNSHSKLEINNKVNNKRNSTWFLNIRNFNVL
jgi:hypothetical protein